MLNETAIKRLGIKDKIYRKLDANGLYETFA